MGRVHFSTLLAIADHDFVVDFVRLQDPVARRACSVTAVEADAEDDATLARGARAADVAIFDELALEQERAGRRNLRAARRPSSAGPTRTARTPGATGPARPATIARPAHDATGTARAAGVAASVPRPAGVAASTPRAAVVTTAAASTPRAAVVTTAAARAPGAAVVAAVAAGTPPAAGAAPVATAPAPRAAVVATA